MDFHTRLLSGSVESSRKETVHCRRFDLSSEKTRYTPFLNRKCDFSEIVTDI